MTFLAPLIIDIAGLTLSKVDRKRLRHPLVGGLILFARNWQDRVQLTALCRDIKKVRSDLLICVDHEGGRVQRFKTDGFTHLPPMRALGEMWMAQPKAKHHAGPMDAGDRHLPSQRPGRQREGRVAHRTRRARVGRGGHAPSAPVRARARTTRARLGGVTTARCDVRRGGLGQWADGRV